MNVGNENNELQAKMERQIGISLMSIQWFILSGWIKSIVENPEAVKMTFKSAEDCQVIESILKLINKQFAPNIDKLIETSEERLHLENVLQLPPDRLKVPTKNLIV